MGDGVILDALKIILLLIGFCSLLFLTYVTTRYIAAKHKKAMTGKHISIVETLALGTDKRIHLLKAGDRYLLIATTSRTIGFLCNVDIDNEASEEKKDQGEDETAFSFRSVFAKYAGMKKESTHFERGSHEDDQSDGLGGGRGFKSNLDRLKAIVRNSEHPIKEDGDENTDEKKFKDS